MKEEQVDNYYLFIDRLAELVIEYYGTHKEHTIQNDDEAS